MARLRRAPRPERGGQFLEPPPGRPHQLVAHQHRGAGPQHLLVPRPQRKRRRRPPPQPDPVQDFNLAVQRNLGADPVNGEGVVRHGCGDGEYAQPLGGSRRGFQRHRQPHEPAHHDRAEDVDVSEREVQPAQREDFARVKDGDPSQEREGALLGRGYREGAAPDAHARRRRQRADAVKVRDDDQRAGAQQLGHELVRREVRRESHCAMQKRLRTGG